MSNEVTDPTGDQMSDTPMESPEKLDKGKGKAAVTAEDAMDDDEDESEEDEEVCATCPASDWIKANSNCRAKARQRVRCSLA